MNIFSLNNDLCRLKKYFDVNRLNINVAKCVYMLISRHQALQKMLDMRVHIDNEPLKRVSVAKYIGMYIDENLKWNVHIDNIVAKISAKIGVLRSLSKIIPTATLKLFYNASVLPHYEYADVVYDSASETSNPRFQKLQTRAAKLISGSGRPANRNPIYKSLDWLSLKHRQDSL